MIAAAGFEDVRVELKEESREFIKDWLPGSGAEDYVVAANVTATKPLVAAAAATTGALPAALMSAACAVRAVLKALGAHHAKHTDGPAPRKTTCGPSARDTSACGPNACGPNACGPDSASGTKSTGG